MTPINAQCQCGQVSYTLTQAPLKVLACHCHECQKLATAPFSVTAVVAQSAIEFHGKMNRWQRIADSGNRNDHYFCPTCGTRIYHLDPDNPELVKLKLKPVGLADDQMFAPQLHVWTHSKTNWYPINDKLPQIERQP